MGKIVKVSGPLVVATGMQDANMADVVRVGEQHLIGEILNMNGDSASIQVYEETSGIGPGAEVVTTGAPLSVELGPGLLENIYDGIQRPLEEIMKVSGATIARGVQVPALNREKKWDFVPTAKVGDTVTAIGNALGTLANTLTTGVVSAKDRAISMSDGTAMKLLQTDCTVNSGNSGGPLFNQYGEVIGIINAKYSSGTSTFSSNEASIEGIGFAIPINDVQTILSDLMKHGYVTGKPYLGITVSTVSSVTAQQYSNMKVGAYVNSVKSGSCAEKAGLKVGDIITEKTLDGEEMDLVVVDMGPDWARFESKDCLPVEVAYNQNNRNAGGFADSDVKRYLNEEVFNSLPEELRNVIAEVERKQENGESSLCRLFLPTESELFGDCCYSEDDTYNQIEYYKDRRNRIKCNRKGGSPDWYWTASVRSGNSTNCVNVNNNGNSNNWNASNELYVPV